MSEVVEGKAVSKQERKQVVLSFLASHDLALPPKVIYRNLKFRHRITFGGTTVENYLDEFVEEGLIKRVNPAALEAGEAVEVPPENNEVRAYYVLTDAGRERARSILEA